MVSADLIECAASSRVWLEAARGNGGLSPETPAIDNLQSLAMVLGVEAGRPVAVAT